MIGWLLLLLVDPWFHNFQKSIALIGDQTVKNIVSHQLMNSPTHYHYLHDNVFLVVHDYVNFVYCITRHNCREYYIISNEILVFHKIKNSTFFSRKKGKRESLTQERVDFVCSYI